MSPHLIRTASAAGAVAVLLAVFGVPASHADDAETRDCLRTAIWEAYDQGWSVRTASSATMKAKESRVFLVTLQANAEYRILSCSDSGAADIDLVLHDTDGLVMVQDDAVGRQPELRYKAPATGSYYVAVHATALNYSSARASVGMAVLYK